MATELEQDEAALVERLAAAVVRRRMAVPAVLLLESCKPLAFLAGQCLHFLAPAVTTLVEAPDYPAAARLLEDREKLEALLLRIEALEAARGKGREAKA